MKVYTLVDSNGRTRTGNGHTGFKLYTNMAQPRAGITNARSHASSGIPRYLYSKGNWEDNPDYERLAAEAAKDVDNWEIVEYELVETGRFSAAAYIPEER